MVSPRAERMAGILRRRLSMTRSQLAHSEENDMTATQTRVPEELSAIPEANIVDLDVRENLRRGEEPFSLIMAAKEKLPPGAALRLRAIFEPSPLYAVLGKQGFAHWTEKFAEDDWRVWFYPQKEVEAETASAAAPGEPLENDEGDDVIVLDVRGMEPPEPMVHTLAALESLPAGKTLLQINERIPHFLLPKLEEQGFTYSIREQNDQLVRVFIRRQEDS